MRPDERSLMSLNVKNKETHQLAEEVRSRTAPTVASPPAISLKPFDTSRDRIATDQRWDMAVSTVVTGIGELK